MKVGDVVFKEDLEYVCLKCECEISQVGECTYECPLDDTEIEDRPIGTVVLNTYKRTVELISVEPYVPPMFEPIGDIPLVRGGEVLP